MRSYYDITLPLTPGWKAVRSTRARRGGITGDVGHDPFRASGWKTPPHAALANLDLTNLKTLEMFTRTYGPLIADIGDIPEAGEEFEVEPTLVGYMKHRLIDAWRERDARRLWTMDGLDTYYLPAVYQRGALVLSPADCFTYARLLLTRDIESGRARICKNPDCNTPYFIAKRRDQVYCEWKCANLITQRNFRKRQRRKR
jgi:hypothetical protein